MLILPTAANNTEHQKHVDADSKDEEAEPDQSVIAAHC
jgi:hypothetical protein